MTYLAVFFRRFSQKLFTIAATEKTAPTSFLIDRDGVLRHRDICIYTSPADATPSRLELINKPPAMARWFTRAGSPILVGSAGADFRVPPDRRHLSARSER